MVFKKTRQSSGQSLHVLECSPAILNALIAAECSYIDGRDILSMTTLTSYVLAVPGLSINFVLVQQELLNKE